VRLTDKKVMLKTMSPIATIISLVALSMSGFHLYIAWQGPPDALTLRATHLAFALILVFLTSGSLNKEGQRRTVKIESFILIVLSIAACAYLVLYQDYIVSRMTYVDPLNPIDLTFGVITILLVLEGTRRAVGWALPITAVGFLTYALTIGGVDFQRVIEQMYMGTEGILGIPLYVSATYVMLFILFGALVERTGTGALFMDFAMGLAGHSAGGPAKVSCITSGMFGTVSGSAVANVMTTGAFTIPLMKRLGYKPAFAGSVEAVASTGGQIMPPIMGATAFIMAEFLGVSYLTVAMYALLPAILYYVALFLSIHFEAKKNGMHGLDKSELPKVSKVLKERGHLFLPLIIIIGTLMLGFSAPFAALCGIMSTIPTALLRKTTREHINIKNILKALEEGAKNTVTVALACACAGIVIGVIFITGLGLEFTNLVLSAANNHLFLALVLTSFAGILLGMGMPTAPAYIMQTALLVPALVKLGVMVEAAHMFVFYFAILSAITPPVALAVYAANGISRASIWDSSITALRLGATGYIIPFMFVFGPSLLLIGTGMEIVQTSITAVIGVICLASGLSGYLFKVTSVWERISLLTAALVLIKPGLESDIIGAALITLTLIGQLRREKISHQ
jgi:TRAP transporter 4TM/12TM fusion protein